MAKVTGPLFSVSATGKLADSIVFFGWKGHNVVRQWLKPANPQTETQGDQRIYMGGTGRAVGKIQPEKVFAQQLVDLGLIPAGQTKQSYLVKYIIDHYLTSTTTYGAELAALAAHTASLAFGTGADDLAIVEFDLDYASVAAYNKGLGLYLIAKASIDIGLEGTPYTTNITTWDDDAVAAMVNDFTSAS